MTPPANPTPADARALATEALRLAEAATPGPWRWVGMTLETDAYDDIIALETKGSPWMEYQVIAMVNRDADQPLIAHAGTHYATLARALLAALDEREAMLADLPHALGTCRCQVMNATPSVGWPKWVYPCTHTAAIARLEERIG